MIESTNSGTSATGPVDTEAYVLIGLRVRLRAKARGGLEMFSKGPSALQQVNHVMGTKFRTAKAAYPAYDKWLVARYPGRVESRPIG